MLANVIACVAAIVFCVVLVVRTWRTPMAFVWLLFCGAFLFLLRDVATKAYPELPGWLLMLTTAIMAAVLQSEKSSR